MTNAIIEVSNLKKSYRDKEIIKGVSFTLEKGEVCGLVGNNGEWKTTIIRTILGLMKPSAGTITLSKEKKYIGYMAQTCRFNDKQTVGQTIDFFAKLRECSGQGAIKLCERFNLDSRKKVKILSPGQQKNFR